MIRDIFIIALNSRIGIMRVQKQIKRNQTKARVIIDEKKKIEIACSLMSKEYGAG